MFRKPRWFERPGRIASAAAVVAAVSWTAGIYPPPPDADAALATIDVSAIAQLRNQLRVMNDTLSSARATVTGIQSVKNSIGSAVEFVSDVRNNPGRFATEALACYADFSIPRAPASPGLPSLCQMTEYVNSNLMPGGTVAPQVVVQRRQELRDKSAADAVALGAQQGQAVKKDAGDVDQLRTDLSGAGTEMADLMAMNARINLKILEELRSMRMIQAEMLKLQGAEALASGENIAFKTPTKINGLGTSGRP
jgi:hypothetical protein